MAKVFQQTFFNGQWVDYGASVTSVAPPNGPDLPVEIRLDLPFNVPTRRRMEDSPYGVGAHYFLSFPIAITSDYTKDVDTRLNADGTPMDPADYRLRWLPKGSIEGGFDNRTVGGLFRDYHALRRAKRTPISSPTKAGLTLTWQIQDKMWEVREAIRAGHDYFFLDILQVPQSAGDMPLRWIQTLQLFDAVAEVQRQDKVSFKIICMPDGTTSGTKNPTTLIDALKYLITTYPDVVYMEEGEFLLAPYQPEGGTAGLQLSGLSAYNFWDTVIKGVQGAGKGCKFWPCYQKDWTATGQHPTLQDLCYGVMIWGDRDKVAVRNDSNARARRAYYYLRTHFPKSQKWCHYIAPGDQRPRETDSATGGSRWWEQDHLETLIGCWEAAIGDTTAVDANGELLHRHADMTQLTTWSDMAENAHHAPSHNHGRTILMIDTYYTIKFKTGEFPKIERDCLILSHRNQPTDNEPTTTVTYPADTLQTKYMKAPTGSTPEQNTVALACFLTAPARVYLNRGGVEYDMGTLPAGFTHGLTVPIAPIGDGTTSAYAVRDGKTVAILQPSADPLFKIRTTVTTTQDYTYKMRDNLSLPVKP